VRSRDACASLLPMGVALTRRLPSWAIHPRLAIQAPVMWAFGDVRPQGAPPAREVRDRAGTAPHRARGGFARQPFTDLRGLARRDVGSTSPARAAAGTSMRPMEEAKAATCRPAQDAGDGRAAFILDVVPAVTTATLSMTGPPRGASRCGSQDRR